MDELQRAARQAQREGKGSGATAIGEAAKELERQQIGRQMRDSAKQLRAPGRDPATPASSPTPAAEAEKEIARALDRVVEKLGGSASADARRMTEQLEQAREMRERLNRLEQQMRDAASKARARGGQEGREGQEGSPSSPGPGQGGELEKLQQEYQRELQRTREALGRLSRQSGGSGTTPEQHVFSQSAPGTESFKQDTSRWESLRKHVDSALENYEASVSRRLARTLSEDRFNAGGSERVPESYRQRIARYYESLAKVKR